MKVNQTWQFWRGRRGGGINRTDDLRVNWTWRFEGKSDLAISGGGQVGGRGAGGVNHTGNLRANWTWCFGGGAEGNIILLSKLTYPMPKPKGTS